MISSERLLEAKARITFRAYTMDACIMDLEAILADASSEDIDSIIQITKDDCENPTISKRCV